MLTLKSLSTTRMVLSLGGGEGRARPSAKDNGSLVALSKDREPKIFNQSSSLLHSICDFEFV